jgi:MATE family multidrug resistance protein
LWQGYLQGVVKALGLQGRVVYINFIAYWIINLPLTLILTFTLDLGFKGLWLAMVFTQFFICFCYQAFVKYHDWNSSAEESYNRM